MSETQWEQLYDTHVSESYDVDRFELLASARAAALRQVAESRSKRIERIVELALGTGDMAVELTALCPDAHLTGLDVSSRMLEAARRKLQDRVVNAELIHDDALQVARHVASDSIDLVVMHHLLNYIEDAPALLAAVHSVLSPGGLFSVVQSTRQAFPTLRQLAAHLVPPEAMAAERLPDDAAALHRWLRQAGFEIVMATEVERPVRFEDFDDFHRFGMQSGWFVWLLSRLAPAPLQGLRDASPCLAPLHDVCRVAVCLVRKPVT